jgi:hypothetical protein
MRASLLVLALILSVTACDKRGGGSPPAHAPKGQPAKSGKPAPSAGAKEEDEGIVPPPDTPGYAPLK